MKGPRGVISNEPHSTTLGGTTGVMRLILTFLKWNSFAYHNRAVAWHATWVDTMVFAQRATSSLHVLLTDGPHRFEKPPLDHTGAELGSARSTLVNFLH